MSKQKTRDEDRAERMKRKAYEKEMPRLHGELVALQEWVKHTGAKICIVFEGRDTAGKGGTIKRDHRARQPARVSRRRAAGADGAGEDQMYMQRYIPHFPAAGEVVIFDRSWYNRAGVERVMGFCTEEQTSQFLRGVPLIERAMVDSGIILLKYWLEVERGRADPAARGAHRRPAQGLEALADGSQVVQPLV